MDPHRDNFVPADNEWDPKVPIRQVQQVLPNRVMLPLQVDPGRPRVKRESRWSAGRPAPPEHRYFRSYHYGGAISTLHGNHGFNE